MRYTIRKRHDENGRRWYTPGIRTKLLVFLLPLVFLLVVSVAFTVTKITEAAIRHDLLKRGVAMSRVVAFSAGYSLLSGDRLAMDRLAAETKNSAPDIEYVAIRDIKNIVVAHSNIDERGKNYAPPERSTRLDDFAETAADEVVRAGQGMIEFTTPILFAGKHAGDVSVVLSMEDVVGAQKSIRKMIAVASSAILGIALLGTLALSSILTTRVKKLSAGVEELASGSKFHPIPTEGGDELGDLTRNFNRMAETILAQQNRLGGYAKELEEAYVGMVRLIAASIDARDPYTFGHSTRVARLSCELGRRLGFSVEELEHLEKACLFHDIGKIRVPDDILLKEHCLTNPEYAEIRSHPIDGAEILGMATSLHRYVPIVRAHHEWFNGEGYPDGKRDSEIPIHAQVIALADAYDAMTTDRPYRKGLSPDQAVEEILRFRGTQFSPMLTDVFVKMVREMPSLETEEWEGMAL
jgi:putative nucleotidyltransferase with HDIG domain